MRLCNGDHQMFRNSMCASSWYLKIITSSSRTHCLFSKLSKRNLMSTGSKIASAISKIRMLLPNATWAAAYHRTSFNWHCTKSHWLDVCTASNPRKKPSPTVLNHGLSRAPSKKHHVQLHTRRTTIYVSHRNYKNSLHRERQKKR